MSKVDVYWSKVFRNILAAYNFNYSGDVIINSIKDHLVADDAHSPWITEYYEMVQNAKGEDVMYVSPCKIVTKEALSSFLAQIDSYPGVKEPFSLLDNTVLIGDLLDLDHNERLVLDLAIKTSRQYTNVNPRRAFEHMAYFFKEKPNEIYKVIFGFSDDDIKTLSKGFLFQSGVLAFRGAAIATIEANLEEPFRAYDLTRESLAEKLFPSTLSTDLTVDLFPHLQKEISRTERLITSSLEKKNKGVNILFWGVPGSGKTELAVALAKKNGWTLRVVGDISEAENSEKSRTQRIANLKIAMRLYGRDPNTIILFDEMEDLFKVDTTASFSKAFINRLIETSPVPIIWTTNSLRELGTPVLRRMIYNIGFEIPPVATRRVIWDSYAAKYGVSLTPTIINDLADDFPLSPALINNAMKLASIADVATDEVPEILSSLNTLMNFGQKMKKPIKTRDDLPYDITCINSDLDIPNLTESLMKAEPRFSLCLYGPPGTGKSEYGRYIAKKLGKKVLFKRASDLQSMYVGECEKNIALAFEEAKDEEMILIIDEADSFLRNREGAHRSWEVSQVNEMLSQMEVHTQPFVMTTNLMSDLDPAAMRRFTFKLKFDYLDSDQGFRLFEAYFGMKGPKILGENEMLTPGDFAVVHNKVKILGVTDPVAIYEMMLQETDLKGRRNKIGF